MKLPDKCTVIVVNYNNGHTDSFFPTSKIEEFDGSYEFKYEKGEGADKETILHVIYTSTVRDILFYSK